MQQQQTIASRNSVSKFQRETSPTVCCLSTGGKFQFLTNQEIEKESNFSDHKDEQQRQQRGAGEKRVKIDSYYTKSDFSVNNCKNRLNGSKVSSTGLVGLVGVEKVKSDDHGSGSEVKKVKKRGQDNSSKKLSCFRDEIGRFERQPPNNNHHHLHENNIINRTTTIITRTDAENDERNKKKEKNIHQRNKLVYDDGKNSQYSEESRSIDGGSVATRYDYNNNRVKISDNSQKQTTTCSEIKSKSVIKQSANLLLHENDFSFIDSSSRSVSRSSSASYDSVNRQQRKYHIPNVSGNDVQEFSLETCANQNSYYSPVGSKNDFKYTDDDDIADVSGDVKPENGSLRPIVDQSTIHENNPVSLKLFTLLVVEIKLRLFILRIDKVK